MSYVNNCMAIPEAWRRLHGRLWSSQFKRNMVWSSVLSAVSTLITGISYTLYLNVLGYEQYGVWLVLSMVVSFYQVGNLGVSQGVAKKVAELDPRRDRREISSYITTGTLMMCAVGALVVLPVCFLRYQVTELLHITGSNKTLIIRLLPLTAIFSGYIFIVDISNNTLNGLGRLDLCYLCQVFLQGLILVTSAIALFAGFGIQGVLIANCLSYLAIHLLSMWLTRRITGEYPLSKLLFSWSKAKSLLTFGGWLFGATIFGLLMSPVNRAALIRFDSLSAIPLYDIPFNTCSRLKSFIESSQKALVAEVSSLNAGLASSASSRIRLLVRKSLGLILYSSVGFILVGLLVTPILKTWLRSRYVPAMSGSFRVMLMGAFFSLLGIPGYYVLLGLGNSVQIFLSNVIQTAANFFALVYFIAQPGGVTAPHLLIAASIGYACSSAWLLGALWLRLHAKQFNVLEVAA